MATKTWEPVIGLEIHAQLLTESKMFSSDATAFGGGDNENVSPVSLGLPGALPVVNKKAVELSVRMGLALNCHIRGKSRFARKNYFYPDLPKGYQISQYDEPLCQEGYVEFFVNDEKKRVRIERAHMEEDAGKSTHHGDYSLINLNRAGVPLLEIVSGPDLRTPQEAAEYARSVRQILRYLGVCDGNLEEGSMRCDCNISIREKGQEKFGTKVELKNINSFRFVEKALEYEIQRQIDCKESGEEIFQETRLYDSTKNKTFSMRCKEEAHDYRYFVDPDLLPVIVPDSWIEKIKKDLPELPLSRAQRFQDQYQLPQYDALILTQERELADYFEAAVQKSSQPKAVSNWMMTELLRLLNENKLDIKDCPISSEHLGELVLMIENKDISGKMAKQVFQEIWNTSKSPKVLVKDLGLSQITDEGAIEGIVDKVMAANAKAVEDYRGGKTKLFGFFVGQAMKESKGQANPETLNKILKKKLDTPS